MVSNNVTYPDKKDLINSEILFDNGSTDINIIEEFQNFKIEYMKYKDLNEK